MLLELEKVELIWADDIEDNTLFEKLGAAALEELETLESSDRPEDVLLELEIVELS